MMVQAVNRRIAATREWGVRSRRSVAGGFAVALLLAGCAFGDPAIRTRVIEMEVAPGANGDDPVPVDIVLAYDPELVKQLTDLSAADWFRRRGEVRLAFPTGAAITSYEVVPGQKGLRFDVPETTGKPIGAFVFAGYGTEGTHRARVDSLEHFAVLLGPKDFSIEPRS
jgi:type VI secretion system protein